jgi:aquaporin SIP
MAMGAAVRAAAADAVVTFLWVFCVSTLGACTAAVTTYLSLHEGMHYALLVTVSILGLLLFAFNLLCEALGGACFNPTDVAAFYAAGLTSPSLFSIALRLPAQVRLRLRCPLSRQIKSNR